MNPLERIVTSNDDLAQFCRQAEKHEYVTVDTEFIRETTYHPKLCLVQLAMPGNGPDTAVLVDVLVPGLALDSVFELFAASHVTKVFHSARQDLEIFNHLGSPMPGPLFDTQVAAMVCGFGYQVAYSALVEKVAGVRIPKSAQLSDWQRRPLTSSQAKYALSDVTHLRTLYVRLIEMLESSQRLSWLDEEFAILSDPSTYIQDPDTAWLKIKTTSTNREFLSIVRELARYREYEALRRNVIRKRVMADKAILDIARLRPVSVDDLRGQRHINRTANIKVHGRGIVSAVQKGLRCPVDQRPKARPVANIVSKKESMDLLRVLLKMQAREHGIAEQMIATAADLHSISNGKFDIDLMKGWRYEVFGRVACKLCEGKIALKIDRDSLRLLEVNSNDT